MFKSYINFKESLIMKQAINNLLVFVLGGFNI